MRKVGVSKMGLLCVAAGLWAGAAQAAPPRAGQAKYLVVLRGVEEVSGVKSGITDEIKRLFIAELKRHPEFNLDWPSDLPEAGDELAAALKRRKLKAFEVTLRVLSVTRTLEPPPAGKQFRVLGRGIRLSVFGDTVPEKVMAIGGDGEANIASEVGRQLDEEKEGKALLLEACKTAITQAVDMTSTKLALSAKDARPRLK
jgi:hypothetical protein